MANKNKGQYLLDGTLQEWWDVDAYHKGNDAFDLTVDETDGLTYLTINGQKVGQGVDVGGGGGKTRYNISKSLTKASLANTSDVILEGATYASLVVPANGYEVETVSVTMGSTAVANAFNEQTQTITVANVRGDLAITVIAQLKRVDMLDITWANHAITCGQNTDNYNAWSPHNLQYDDANDCFVFLQCHVNKHIQGTYSNWTLTIIDPYDPTYCENVNIPPRNGLGMLWIENGVWWIITRGSGVVYRSSDMGEHWETISTPTPQYCFGVYKAGGKYFAGNDSNTEHTYYVSDDLLNWETKSFGELGYDILCETTFCEFQGKIWAFNRTNDEELGHPVILNSSDGGETWTVFSDQLLHGWRSTVSCLPFDSYIAIADIARNEGYVYYSIFDGETVTELKEWKVLNVGNGDDLHNVNLATNYKDAVIVEFMHPSPCTPYIKWNNSDYACDNVMIVGGTKQLPSVEFYDNSIVTVEDFVAYANANWTTGTNGYQFPTWTAPNGGAIHCTLPSRDFLTELEIPLNMIVWRNVDFAGSYLFNKGKALHYWNNENATVGSVQLYTADPCVEINNTKYFLFNVSRSQETDHKLMLLLKMPRFIEQDVNATSTGLNEITNQSWQENLGFRRVIPAKYDGRYNEMFSVATQKKVANNPNGETTIGFAKYVPAPPAE